jgi:hypothetical protein
VVQLRLHAVFRGVVELLVVAVAGLLQNGDMRERGESSVRREQTAAGECHEESEWQG